MPGCLVKHCSNNGRKGFRLFRIPTNLKRRNLWLRLIASEQDQYNLKNLRVCEIHFSEKQFRTFNGIKKLKRGAFPDLLPPVFKNEEILMANEWAVGEFINVAPDVDHEDVHISYAKDEHISYSKDEEILILQHQLKEANDEIIKLREKYKSLKARLKGVFSDDQITFLEGQGRLKGVRWSDEMISKCLKLYQVCGANGYNELLRQGLPYPKIQVTEQQTA